MAAERAVRYERRREAAECVGGSGQGDGGTAGCSSKKRMNSALASGPSPEQMFAPVHKHLTDWDAPVEA